MDPLTYRQVLERYDRARAFGEKRSLKDYAQHMNTVLNTDRYTEGLRDGPWTRFSTRADQVLEGTVGQITASKLCRAWLARAIQAWRWSIMVR